MTEKKKDYVSPQTEVMKVQPMQMLCGSTGSFRLSDNEIEKGEDNVWSEPETTFGM